MGEDQGLNQDQLNEALFLQLVLMFQGAAMQHMGKLMNPLTQKVERDLQQAKGAIDMLGMLETKTRGNLSEQEKKLLEHVLFELRMNYMDEVNKPEPEKEEAEKEPEEAAKKTPQESQEEKESPEEKKARPKRPRGKRSTKQKKEGR